MRELRIDAGRRVGVTSDTHYNHRKIIAYCQRPWLYLNTDNRHLQLPKVTDDCLVAHDNALVDRINAALGPDDVLLHGGDVAWGDVRKLGEFYERLRVREVYVAVGNHDSDDDLRCVFGEGRVDERWLVTVAGPGGDRTAVLDHYPGHSWHSSHKGAWQLFGHVHGAMDRRHEQHPGWLLSLDVGVDSHDFKPWLWHEELVPAMDRRVPAWKEWRDREYATPKEQGGMSRAAAAKHQQETSPCDSRPS
jgi:calcineurin-like phosphoesterase family protein